MHREPRHDFCWLVPKRGKCLPGRHLVGRWRSIILAAMEHCHAVGPVVAPSSGLADVFALRAKVEHRPGNAAGLFSGPTLATAVTGGACHYRGPTDAGPAFEYFKFESPAALNRLDGE